MGKEYGENLPSKSQLIKFQDQVSALRSEASSIELRFAYEKIPYNADMIAENIKAQKRQAIKKEDPSNIVYDFIDQYIEEHQHIREKGSLSVYKALKRHLKNCQRYTRTKVKFDKIDFNFHQSFQNFLIKWE